MKCFSFKYQGLFLKDAIRKIQPHAFHRGQPRLNGEQIIIPGWPFVAQPALDYWKNQVLLLPFKKSCSELPKEFTARAFQHIEIA